MPGDDLLPGSGSATRAITNDAPPEAIWPWLVQMGYGRSGWYTNEFIDQLTWGVSARNRDRILPEYQRLEQYFENLGF